MSESNDDTAPTGDEAGEAAITREIIATGRDPGAAKALRDRLNRANNRNAGRPEVAPPLPPPRLTNEEWDRTIRHAPFAKDTDRIPPNADPSDPTLPVVGPLEIIETVVRYTQRYGAFQYWPAAQKTEALGLVTRTAKQLAIAQQVTAVARRDTVHARAYNERKKLIREAAQLLKSVVIENAHDNPTIAEATIESYREFVSRIAALQQLPDDAEEKTNGA